MARNILLVPTGVGVGLATVCQAFARALDFKGVSAQIYQPISDQKNKQTKGSLSTIQLEHWLSEGESDTVLETIVAACQQHYQSKQIILVQGILPTRQQSYATRLNYEICKALDAKIVLVTSPEQLTLEQMAENIEITAQDYGGLHSDRILGCIVNKVGESVDEQGFSRLDLATDRRHTLSIADIEQRCRVFGKSGVRLLGCIPWQSDFIAPRVKDIIDFLQAKVINRGDCEIRRIKGIALCARSVSNIVEVLKPSNLVITAADRSDVIVAVCLAALSGVKIAGLLLTGNYPLSADLLKLCEEAFRSGLPVLSVPTDSFRTAIRLQNIDHEIPVDDEARLEYVTEFSARHISLDWLEHWIKRHYTIKLSPPAFRYQLVENARQQPQRIILPEGTEPRTLAAAINCVERNIAHCMVMGERETIQQVAAHNGLQLPEQLTIVEPEAVMASYLQPLLALRQHKGLTEEVALEYLKDNVVLGTMMLQQGKADGLVSGAEHTTANTIRPALQLIKTAPDAKLVSSIFFMCLPEQVLVYGDCAVNPDPNAEQLADIAIQSADSALAFGIEPRVAMISYSTGMSGQGSDVEKVRAATHLVKEQRPDIVIDGPLQYDAALNQEVAKAKAPDSPVAGRATVVIFPDLNTGNTTYKAVQRSAKVLSIGPMLQGLNKPVNDLSRGASVDDIIYTIALTAIQAQRHAVTQ